MSTFGKSDQTKIFYFWKIRSDKNIAIVYFGKNV